MPNPHHAHIEPTTLCDLKCRSCVNEGLPAARKGHLALSDLKKIIEQNPFLKDISLIGLGEPMLNPELPDMAYYLKNKGLQTRTGTNGMNLHKVNLEKLLSSVDELVVSFDSDEKNSFESIRTGSDFGQITGNIKKISRLKKSRKLSFILSFQTVISKENLSRINRIPPLAKSLGADKVRFSAAVQYNPVYGSKTKEMDYEKIRGRIRSLQNEDNASELEKQIENKLKSICQELELQFSFSGFKPRYKDCWWPGNGIYVTYDGFVTPCCMRMNPAVLNFGNLFHQPFDEIKKGNEYTDFIDSFNLGSCHPVCKECPK